MGNPRRSTRRATRGRSSAFAPSCLLDDERRHEQLEVALPGPPPVFRDLLMPGHDEIPLWTRREVADDGRLEVNAGSHAAMSSLRDTCRPAAIAFA
jgi:hypothetical protein